MKFIRVTLKSVLTLKAAKSLQWFSAFILPKASCNLLLEEGRKDSGIIWKASSSENNSVFLLKCSESEVSDHTLNPRHAIVRAGGKVFLFTFLLLSF